MQNRVTPFGTIVAQPGRGLFTGNRGILVDGHRSIVRKWQVRRWIACRLSYKGIRRELMRPDSWTELFFLDEAVALSAGHRPCAECRRADYKLFQAAWSRCFDGIAKADAIDDVLHVHRIAKGEKVVYRAPASSLPDGAFVDLEDGPWLVLGDSIYRWTNAGYVESKRRPTRSSVIVLTPRPIVEVLA